MSTEIPTHFIKDFGSDVKLEYQRKGSKLRNTVRRKNGIKGESTTFFRAGKGAASQKTRHGDVPLMNADRTKVECYLQDWYAGDLVDKLDELKIQTDERMVVVNSGVYALGRKTDELIINALDGVGAGQVVGDGTAGLTLDAISAAYELLDNADVPDDGQRYAPVGTHQWEELLRIKPFYHADFVGGDALPWPGMEAKRWRNTLWFKHSGLPLAAGVRSVFIYHMTAVGHASGQDVTTDITWQGLKAAHFINNMMSQGAVLIDETGIAKIKCDDDEALAAVS